MFNVNKHCHTTKTGHSSDRTQLWRKVAAEEAEGVETRVCKNDAAHVEIRTIPKLESETTLKTGNNAVLITLVVLISLAALAGITVFVKRRLMK